MPSHPAFEIVTVKSGAKSLRCLQRKETFHPGIGPTEEAKILHVDQQGLVERCQGSEPFVLWDIGLGAAANAITAVDALRGTRADKEIHSFDISLSSLEFALTEMDSLTYLAPYADLVVKLVTKGFVEIEPGFRWYFHGGDFRESVKNPVLPAPHAIFFDPYSPATNPEMWTQTVFESLRNRTEAPCLLTNYTRSTSVRVTLLLAGFYVGIGTIIGEKDETTVASNDPFKIKRPLGREWLERVKISRNGAPMRIDAYKVRPIEEADYALLAKHPQFADV